MRPPSVAWRFGLLKSAPRPAEAYYYRRFSPGRFFAAPLPDTIDYRLRADRQHRLAQSPARRAMTNRKKVGEAANPHAEMRPLLAQAAACLEKGKLAEAETACSRILAVHPRDGDALQLAGIVAYLQKNYAVAIERLGKAARLASANAGVFSNLGLALLAAGQSAEAVIALLKATQL